MGLNVTDIWLVARQDVTDFVRDRAAMRRIIRSPLRMLAFVIVFASLPILFSAMSNDGTDGLRRMADDFRQASPRPSATRIPVATPRVAHTVTIDGVPLSHPLARALADDGFRIHEDADSFDARLFVIPETDTSPMVVHVEVRSGDGADDRTRDVAAALDRYALTETARRAEAAGLPARDVHPVRVELAIRQDRASTPARSPLGGVFGLLPIYAMVPLTSLIGLASRRVSGARDRRVIEPLLVLPLSRPSVLVGKGVAAFAIGALNSAPVLLVMAVLGGALAKFTSLDVGAAVVATVIVGLVAFAVLAVAYGLYVGAKPGTATAGSRAVFVLIFLAFLSDALMQTVPWAIPGLLTVPGLGFVLLLREAAASGANALHASIVVGSSLGAAAVFVWLGARHLARDETVLRRTA